MSRADAPVSFTLPIELKDEFEAIAKRNHRNRTQELIIAVQEHIERERAYATEGSLPQQIGQTVGATPKRTCAQGQEVQSLQEQIAQMQQQMQTMQQQLSAISTGTTITQTAGHDAQIKMGGKK